MKVSEVIDSLGVNDEGVTGCRILADKMGFKYRPVKTWYYNEKVPAQHVIRFVDACNALGLNFTVVEFQKMMRENKNG